MIIQFQFFQEIVNQVNSSNLSTDLISKSFSILDRRIINPSGNGVSNFTYAINESSHTDDDEDDDDASSPPRSTNHITTTDLVFDQSSSNSLRYPHPRLPRVVIRQSSPQENDNNATTTTTTTYGSVPDSLSTSFTTPRAANFFVGSLGGTTDNTNISARSVIEDVSDIETDENDERMHSVLTDVEINQGYVPDEEPTEALRTNL